MKERRSYSSNNFELEIPNLLQVQKNSYKNFLQLESSSNSRKKAGLEKIFRDIFPVTDVKEQYALSYLGYNIGTPKYSISECRERGLTYSVPLSAKLNLKIFEDAVEEGKEKLPKEERINDVFICDLPQMTNEGSFIINGAERVVVSQLHRSPGVSFDEEYHTNGAKIWKSRIIPYRGSWVEFQIDPNEVLYVSIDRRKKFPATILIKALSAFAPADVVNANSPSQHKASDFEGDDGGYSAFKKSIMSNEDLLDMFYEKETITITDTNAEDFIGKILFTDAIDTEQTGEIVAEANSVLDQEILNRLLDADINKIEIISKDINVKKAEKDDDMEEDFSSIIHNTLALDTTKDCEEALAYVYTQLRQGDSPNLATAKSHFGRIFFNAKQYDLGEVGRYRLNSRLGINVNLSRMVITSDDFMAIIGYMVGLANGIGVLDDIDHLGNRRARSVGELLSNQLSVGLTRMARAIKDRLTLRDQEEITPNVLVNSRTVSSVVNQFFGSSQLSQFMDQTNPLAEITHKRRMSALGPGGLTRERAGFEVRDVHHTHYGRLCPIETPEGPNIGLINSLATYSIINHFGFLETPYRIVGDVEFKSTKDETVFIPELKWHFDVFRGFTQEPELFVKEELTKGEMSGIRSTLDKIQKQHFDDFANKVFKGNYRDEIVFMKNGKILHDYDGKADYIQSSDEPVSRVTTFIIYLTADSEDHYKVAPASTILTENQEFRDAYVILRAQGEFPVLPNSEVELMDVSQKQIVSIAAGLIPFLEHDDANRALMGSNMQRQAVPLLRSQAPVVGTGMERRAALDSGSCILSQFDGVVDFVDASKIIVKREEYKEEETFLGLTEYDTYVLRKYERSNQETCINQKPIVFVGNKVKAGDVLADGASTDQGELALGKNIRIAFLPWNGYNYEDAIIISEELVKKDVFTSIHIEEFEVEVRDTKRGPEELTRQIPNVSEEAVLNLDEDGVIRIGAELEHGDIIVGKVTPKGETELSPEERLLRAIFGEKAGDVRDTSLKAPPGMKGVVIHTRTFTRKDKSASKATEQELIRQVQQDFIARISKIEQVRESRLAELLVGQTSGNIIRTETNEVLKQSGKKITEATLGKINFNEIALSSELSNDAEVNAEAIKAIKLSNSKIEEYQEVLEKEINKITKGDELKPGVQKTVKVYVAKKRTLQIGDKMAGRHGNKGVISKVVPVEDMPFTKDGEPVQIMLNPLGVPSRMNVGQVLEVHLGWAAMAMGIKVATPVFDGATFDEIQDALVEAGFDKSGKTKLIDGRTGEYFKSEVTVGYMYMLKLGHLVSDKMHARSIGPYSLVTQQPLGGKSQFGGQRFGEMEVWALEAYGAAYTLQELLTVKSDDVIGRSKIYEAIVKGENTPSPGIPESFRVLIKEIRALGLYIKTGDES